MFQRKIANQSKQQKKHAERKTSTPTTLPKTHTNDLEGNTP